MLDKWKQLSAADRIKHIVLYLIGVGIMPLGVVLTINAHLGSGGFDALNFAIADLLKINTSFAIYGTSFIVLIITAIIRRGFPRFQTFISSFFLGFFTDIWRYLLKNVEGTTVMISILLMCAGIIIIGFSVACYIISIFPTNPNDDFLVALKEKNWNITFAKILLDGVCVILAFIFKGEIGIGTIICMFGIGPVIDFSYKVIKKIFSV